MKFALLIADALDERTKLLAVLAHVEASEAQTAGPEGLIDWLRFRCALQISARSAKLDLDEARAASEPSPEWHYPRPIELHLWSIDEDAAEVTSLSQYEWRSLRTG